MDRNIWILIPAYNECKTIGAVLGDLRSQGYTNILVVDDDSKDKTANTARDGGAEVMRHLINRGQGGALQTGLQYLAAEYIPDVIVTFDADGQHQAKDIKPLIQPILDGNSDIVLGSRFLEMTCNIPFFRKIILKLGIIFTAIVSDIKLTDTHNGLRALSKKAYTSIDITHRGMEHASDIIDEIKKKGLRYSECPVTILYTDYSKMKGQSSLGFIRMGLKILLKKLM